MVPSACSVGPGVNVASLPGLLSPTDSVVPSAFMRAIGLPSNVIVSGLISRTAAFFTAWAFFAGAFGFAGCAFATERHAASSERATSVRIARRDYVTFARLRFVLAFKPWAGR